MRKRDEQKQEAITQATIRLVNETGFAASSVAKIAREADVSPATIYIYYENKEDLLVSTYLGIKRKISKALLEGLDESLPIRDSLQLVWRNILTYIAEQPGYFRYSEQFANSPYEELVDEKSTRAFFEPILKVLQKGIDQRIIKDVPLDMLVAFNFFPATYLAKARLRAEGVEGDLHQAFAMAWDAIKL